MNNIYEEMSWLLRPPQNIKTLINNISNSDDLRSILRYSLDNNQLNTLAKKIKLLQEEKPSLKSLTDLKLGIVSNTNSQLLTPAILATAPRYGLSLYVIETEYNQVAQSALSDTLLFEKGHVDAILVSITYHGLPISPAPGELDKAEEIVQNCIQYLQLICSNLQKKTNAKILLQNIVPPIESYFGSFERGLYGTLQWIIHQINFEIEKFASDSISIVDMAGASANIGLENWHDPTLWNIGKIPFAQTYAPFYADYICRILGSIRGKSRRCLILDLDNTLWGGVIGDDGVEGILLGNGDPTGEAFINLQKNILDLKNRGVVLAVSSKNTDEIARKPFKEHPDMLIKENDIAIFQANWTDKATNIRKIAENLSLGLESMVLLDDNPAERMQVRNELPTVAVPELPENPALFSRMLFAAGYFEAVTFSKEDKERASFYLENSQRTALKEQSSDMDSYLKSLNMEIFFSSFDKKNRPRITQLINKSNQFNLTTKRLNESEIGEIENSPSYFTLQIRLKDIFGDNGMISAVICKKNIDGWEIELWLMSCRVLNRGVEESVLEEIIRVAKLEGALYLKGIFIPSDRNAIVKNHYEKLGFEKLGKKEDKEIWGLNLKKDLNFKHHIKFNYVV
jgi:FkbH-like protein